jgi:hypothetical protein
LNHEYNILDWADFVGTSAGNVHKPPLVLETKHPWFDEGMRVQSSKFSKISEDSEHGPRPRANRIQPSQWALVYED